MVKIPTHKNIAQAVLFHEGAKKMSPEDVYHTPAHETRRKGTLSIVKKVGIGALALVTLGVGANHIREGDKAKEFDRTSVSTGLDEEKLPYKVLPYDSPSSIADKLSDNPKDQEKIKNEIKSQLGDDGLLQEGEGVMISQKLLDNDPNTNPGDNK